ncbi:unnamed protein product (macronuclear) [Paramecium tetraurelia]|uniref:Uncharacterized protein n=1 Tax=Paramecium tetraurelia TaxID=5888 RepID=A0BMJ9_PARTE|nr:uncharacterized protein GSPATT00030402001 [Paramecium tetraurelia]CAK59766.1 unnamed protein product [Paramecium tetraurelia]|eukprot:XP_001427164.1 hypothetical protein (macronuclear) [Paramecium tetraurelia strain d4-2]
MQSQIDALKQHLEYEKQIHDKQLKQVKLDGQKEIAVLQDELDQLKVMIENVDFQQYIKMKSDNKNLIQENAILREMLRASQITGSTKEIELKRLKQKMHRYESHSLQLKKDFQVVQWKQQQSQFLEARNLSHHRNQTQPSLLDSTAETSTKLLPIKFKINQ